MSKERPFSELISFLPPNTFDSVLPYFRQHTIHLKLVHERKSVLGDYRSPSGAYPFHRISINANLAPFSFLITLLHELAHMQVYNQHQHNVKAHGSEWKQAFQVMLTPFLKEDLFPHQIKNALQQYLQNPKASTCSDPQLYKALYESAPKKEGWMLISELNIGEYFRIENGTQFLLSEKKRTRYKCQQIDNGKWYLFPSVYEVKRITLL